MSICVPESLQERIYRAAHARVVATDTTVLPKQEKLKDLMREFPDRSVEELLKLLEVES
jgi:hypothetical protein